jgi:hypothetical protein
MDGQRIDSDGAAVQYAAGHRNAAADRFSNRVTVSHRDGTA